MSKAIVCCKCGGTMAYSERAYKGLYPNTPVPKIYISKEGYKLLETLPQGSEVHRFLTGVLKKRGRYSYLLSWKEDGGLEEVYNFVKNQRVQ